MLGKWILLFTAEYLIRFVGRTDTRGVIGQIDNQFKHLPSFSRIFLIKVLRETYADESSRWIHLSSTTIMKRLKNISSRDMTFPLVLFLPFLTGSVGAGTSTEMALIEFLLQNYSSSIHPTKQNNTPLDVEFNLKVLQVLSIDEKFQTITIQSYYQVRNSLMNTDQSLYS